MQLSFVLLSQRGAAGGGYSGLGVLKVCNCRSFCSPRGVPQEGVMLACVCSKCATVVHFAFPEGCRRMLANDGALFPNGNEFTNGSININKHYIVLSTLVMCWSDHCRLGP